jgi:hypothetical protein
MGVVAPFEESIPWRPKLARDTSPALATISRCDTQNRSRSRFKLARDRSTARSTNLITSAGNCRSFGAEGGA